MMIDLHSVLNKYGIKSKGVIQVGAHWAEEHDEFVKLGVQKFVYIEPSKSSYDFLVKKLIPFGEPDVDGYYGLKLMNDENTCLESIQCFRVACGASSKEIPMYVSHQNQGQSNSILKPNLHIEQHPEIIFDDAEIVQMRKLDELDFEKSDFNLLVMDCQGYEGEVLKGAEETLKHIKVIYTEVNRGQTYEGNMEIDEMDTYLGERGFIRVETHWPSPNWTWGDAVFIRKELL